MCIRDSVNSGLPKTNKYFDDLAVLDTMLYVSVVADSGKGGVYRSVDYGATWKQFYTSLKYETINTLVTHKGILYVESNTGVCKTTDYGDSWVKIDSGIVSHRISTFMFNGTTVVAAGRYNGGIFRSDDNGVHWRAINSGLLDKSINSVILLGTTYYVGTDRGGIFLSLIHISEPTRPY